MVPPMPPRHRRRRCCLSPSMSRISLSFVSLLPLICIFAAVRHHQMVVAGCFRCRSCRKSLGERGCASVAVHKRERGVYR
ncbi:hypothetical protein Hanom_Chr04g00313731 [Helianthus anomalus]